METISIPRQGTAMNSSSLHQRLMHFLTSDPRNYQILFLSIFMFYGIFSLGWDVNLLKILIIFSVCLLTQYAFSNNPERDYTSLKSAVISSLSLCLILKTNFLFTAAIAAFLSIAGKFLIRINGKHVFNPTNFGIILAIVLTGDAWISSGQWGSNAILVFLLGSLGLMVLLKVKRLDTALFFYAAFGLYHFLRSVLFLGWTMDVFLQQMTNGTVMLFAFFMITDPKTTPSAFPARVIWASLIGLLAAYLQIHHWVNGAPLWALFILSPFTPLLDRYFGGSVFHWNEQNSSLKISEPVRRKKVGPSPIIISLSIVLFMLAIPFSASSFCGFYVAKADASLFNKSSQVILVRDGDHSVITMSSDYTGELKDFAMVVPVPVVLKKSDIRIVERVLFDSFDAYSGPRLVEYWDENPCWRLSLNEESMPSMSDAASSRGDKIKNSADVKSAVKIEAQYVIGEYDILILSAEESDGLEKWLTSNGYRIPSGARDVLEPYIRSGMKFFVVKVNLEGYRSEGAGLLRPLQIAFNSPKFMLPIRLGMANSKDRQDMIVYALSRSGRVETSNYRMVNMPTDRKVPEFVREKFGQFYKDTYENVLRREGRRNVFLEYGWDISGNNFMKCDPCTGNPPVYADLITAGASWLRTNGYGVYEGSVYFTRLHLTYDRENFPQDLVFQETPNRQNFQARYILTHPAPGPFDCAEGKSYLYDLRKRRYRELQELYSLTGWEMKQFEDYPGKTTGYIIPIDPGKKNNTPDKSKPIQTGSNQVPLKDTSSLSISNQNNPKDSITVEAGEWNPQYGNTSAGNTSEEPDYKVILAIFALAFLYFMERSRK